METIVVLGVAGLLLAPVLAAGGAMLLCRAIRGSGACSFMWHA